MNILVKLKRQFIAISMSLVAFVLIVIFSSILMFFYRILIVPEKNDLENSAIEILINKYDVDKRYNDMQQGKFVFLYLKTDEGYKFLDGSMKEPLSDEQFNIIYKYLSSREDSDGYVNDGINAGKNILYMKRDFMNTGNEYLALSYTKTYMVFSNLFKALLTAFMSALVLIFFVASFLANWALRPVERAWKLQKQFIGDASHELKTPLTVILANLKILKRDESLTAEQSKWVDNTNDEAIRMKDLVEEMLYLARGDIENNKFNGTDVNFSELVEEVLLTFESLAFEKGLSLMYDNIEEDIYCVGDKQQLKRMLIILVDNAVKYSDPGNDINVYLYKNDKKIFFKITSIGEVIKAENAKKIFERFIRESESRARNSVGGYGLGLSIAKNIVENHKGKIKWEPYDDIGNSFIVELEG